MTRGTDRDNISKAERAGRLLGRLWGELVRQDARLSRWMVNHGVAPAIATAIAWSLKLAVVVLFAYAALFAVALLLFTAIIARASRDVSLTPEDKTEWRDGLLGFGLYDDDGNRIDPYDPNTQKPI